jgi:hypothetical protein
MVASDTEGAVVADIENVTANALWRRHRLLIVRSSRQAVRVLASDWRRVQFRRDDAIAFRVALQL